MAMASSPGSIIAAVENASAVAASAASTVAVTTPLFDGAPSDVYVARIDGSNERRVSNVNADLVREVGFSRAERLQFTSADGTPIEGWLMYPQGYRTDGTKYPLVLSNHGGPHSADGYTFDFKSQYFAANGYFVLKVNFRSSTGYGEKFERGIELNWGGKIGLFFMGTGMLAFALTWRCVPETKGRTFQELDHLFENKTAARAFRKSVVPRDEVIVGEQKVADRAEF